MQSTPWLGLLLGTVTLGQWSRRQPKPISNNRLSWPSFVGALIQPVHPKGDQSWVFIGRTDAEAETPVLWPPHAKSWLIGKDSDTGRDWGQEEQGTTEDEMAGWHQRLDTHEFGWTGNWWWTERPGVLQFMGSQRVGHDWATELNWTEGIHVFGFSKYCQKSFSE